MKHSQICTSTKEKPQTGNADWLTVNRDGAMPWAPSAADESIKKQHNATRVLWTCTDSASLKRTAFIADIGVLRCPKQMHMLDFPFRLARNRPGELSLGSRVGPDLHGKLGNVVQPVHHVMQQLHLLVCQRRQKQRSRRFTVLYDARQILPSTKPTFVSGYEDEEKAQIWPGKLCHLLHVLGHLQKPCMEHEDPPTSRGIRALAVHAELRMQGRDCHQLDSLYRLMGLIDWQAVEHLQLKSKAAHKSGICLHEQPTSIIMIVPGY